MADTSKHILAIKVGGDNASLEQHLRRNVEGGLVVFSDEELAEMQDESRLRKVYKIDATAKEAEAFVLGSMSLKGS